MNGWVQVKVCRDDDEATVVTEDVAGPPPTADPKNVAAPAVPVPGPRPGAPAPQPFVPTPARPGSPVQPKPEAVLCRVCSGVGTVRQVVGSWTSPALTYGFGRVGSIPVVCLVCRGAGWVFPAAQHLPLPQILPVPSPVPDVPLRPRWDGLGPHLITC